MYEKITTAQAIRERLEKYVLPLNWLVRQIRLREITVDKTVLCAVLNGRRKGPKAEMLLKISLEILESYEEYERIKGRGNG